MILFNFFKDWKTRRKLRRQGAVGNVRKHTEESEFLQNLNQSRTLGIFIMVLLWGVSSLLLSLPLEDDGEIFLEPGDVIPQTILADFEFEFADTERTDALRRGAQERAPVYYSVRETAADEIKSRYRKLLQAAADRSAAIARGQEFKSEPGIAEKVREIPQDVLAGLNSFSRNAQAGQNFDRTLSSLLSKGILSVSEKFSSRLDQKARIINTLGHERAPERVVDLPDVESAAGLLAEAMLDVYPRGPQRDALKKGFVPLCRDIIGKSGSLVRNEARTRMAKREAAGAVRPVMVKVPKKSPVLRAEFRVTQQDLDRYHTYLREKKRQERARFNTFQILRNVVWSFLLALFVGFYMWHLHPDVVASNRKILLFSSIILFSLLEIYGTAQLFVHFRGSGKLPMDLIINVLPISLASVLLAVTMGFRAALFGGFLVSGFCCMLWGQRLDYALEGMFVCSFCAVYVRSAVDYRNFFIRTFLTVFIANCLLEFNLLAQAEGDLTGIAKAACAACGGALLTAMSALLLVFFYELFFRVDTNMSLMVLCNYSHPLLERMKREATGTFFHSLMVATLSEDAARAIGANPLKTKVGAMFHDIGKLSKPQYFIENNLEMASRHVDLKPQVSSIIIRDHVKEGLDLARKEKLSRVIIDAIEQHHGTDLVHYFYRRALEETRETGAPVTEVQYRYQGVPPRDKEMAIISLADACEAACRSLEKPSASRVESLVDEIFRKRFRDGQLSNAALTLAELQKVRDSFVNDLVCMRHGRIAYQKENEENDQGELFVEHGKTPGAGTENTGKAD